jgi:hypothetical protein
MQYGGNRFGTNEVLSIDRVISGTPYSHLIEMCHSKIDMPIGFTDVLKYNGTLAHKTNHNFNNNVDATKVCWIG